MVEKQEDERGAAEEHAEVPTLRQRTAHFEREQIRAALVEANGVKTRAALSLGLTYRGLVKKMKRLGL